MLKGNSLALTSHNKDTVWVCECGYENYYILHDKTMIKNKLPNSKICLVHEMFIFITLKKKANLNFKMETTTQTQLIQINIIKMTHH